MEFFLLLASFLFGAIVAFGTCWRNMEMFYSFYKTKELETMKKKGDDDGNQMQ